MILVRPRQDKKSLTMILNDLAEIPFNKIYNEIHKYDNMTALLGDDTIKLFLPRFEISSNFNLNEVLDAMGIKDVFNERDADLDNIAQNVELYVSRIMHSAKITVDEEGAVASSATVVETESKMEPPIFRANRPFLFFLYDKYTKSVIFAGKYADPK